MSSYGEIKMECYEANLLLPEYRLIDLTFGNVSIADHARGVFAIKPSGVDYRQMNPEEHWWWWTSTDAPSRDPCVRRPIHPPTGVCSRCSRAFEPLSTPIRATPWLSRRRAAKSRAWALPMPIISTGACP